MARFVVLKGGQSHTVFEFDGNIARVGAGEAMDLRLEGTKHEGDLFFLTKSSAGYDLERRAPKLEFTVNGKPGSDRVALNDGDKIAFEDFLVIVTYPPMLGTPAPESAPEHAEKPQAAAPQGTVSRDTAPVTPMAPPPPEPEAAKPASVEPPPAPGKPAGSEKATTLIDIEELERRAQAQQKSPPPQQQQAKPAPPPKPTTARQEPPKTKPPKPEQPKAPGPPPPPRGSEKETRIISAADLPPSSQSQQPSRVPSQSQRQAPPQQRQTEPPAQRPVEQPPADSRQKQRIRAEYSLVGLSGQYKGRAQEIDCREFVVGRDPRNADLVIDRNEKGELEKSISREHFAIISSEDGLLYLVDKKSKLRTYINGRVIEPNQRENITPEDVISIPAPTGEVVFRLCYRGQENYEPLKKNAMLVPALILLAVIVVLAIILLVLLLGD